MVTQETCLECPTEASCSSNVTIETLSLKANFWRLSAATTDIKKCPEEGGVAHSACTGGSAPLVTAHGRRAAEVPTSEGIYCRDGHTGPRCEVCEDPEFYYSTDTHSCEGCPSTARAVGVVILIVSVIGVLVAAYTWLWRRVARSHLTPAVAGQRWLQSFFLFLRSVFGVDSSLQLAAKFKVLLGFYRLVKRIELTASP